jgi:hypothetical protein
MKVSEICKIVNDCDRARDILRRDKHKLIDSEIQEICNLLWDYREELMEKEVKIFVKSVIRNYFSNHQ